MKIKTVLKQLGIFTSVFFLVILVFFWTVKDDWRSTLISFDSVQASYSLPELTEGTVIEQEFHAPVDTLRSISVTPVLWEADPESTVVFSIFCDGEQLMSQTIPTADLKSGEPYTLTWEVPVLHADKPFLLRIEGNGGCSFFAGNSISTGRFDVEIETENKLCVNGEPVQGELAMPIIGAKNLHVLQWFWPVACLIYLGIVIFLYTSYAKTLKGKKTLTHTLHEVWHRYRYLVKMLVSRDFKVKYKASVLGVLWSFLNPFLMTGVYYFVFSTIFRSSIDNFVVYLMSGIILFNYFSEATNLGLISIVGNSSLIKKVYVPKMIYPLSRVLSSAINLLISFIPLLIIMLLTGVPLHKSLLLLPLCLIFLLLFTAGMAFILSSLNVFFRDTQFLWSILLTIWNFMTPIFYPESIIPGAYRTLYHLNPLYQFVYFARTVIIGGISPTPITYLYCILASVIPFAIGLFFFRKTQDKFTLYL